MIKRLILLLISYCCYNVVVAVNINIASVEDLQKIKGITHKKALLIVNHRRKYGLYNNTNELIQIKGISAKWVLKMQNQLAV
jgi:competence protein ComEA